MWGKQLCVLGTGAPLKDFKADKVQAQDIPNSVVTDPQEQVAVVQSHVHKPSLEEHLFKKHRDKKLPQFQTVKLELFYWKYLKKAADVLCQGLLCFHSSLSCVVGVFLCCVLSSSIY